MKNYDYYKSDKKEELLKNMNKKEHPLVMKEGSSYRNKEPKPPSKSEMAPKFSYSFQPSLNPAMKSLNTNSVKTMNYNLGYRPLQSIKSEFKPMNPYKY